MTPIERYVLELAAHAIESRAEDAIDENGVLHSDEAHEAAIALALDVARALRERPDEVLNLAEAVRIERVAATVALGQPTPEQVLACPMPPNDPEAETVGDYLITLLATVWAEKEGFSGKRPFGTSGWTLDIEGALVRAGLVKGAIDGFGLARAFDPAAVEALVGNAIRALRTAGGETL